jgi:hypothetical protein
MQFELEGVLRQLSPPYIFSDFEGGQQSRNSGVVAQIHRAAQGICCRANGAKGATAATAEGCR